MGHSPWPLAGMVLGFRGRAVPFLSTSLASVIRLKGDEQQLSGFDLENIVNVCLISDSSLRFQ